MTKEAFKMTKEVCLCEIKVFIVISVCIDSKYSESTILFKGLKAAGVHFIKFTR